MLYSVLGSAFLLTAVSADKVSFYRGETCNSEPMGACEDLGASCCSIPIDAGSYVIERDDNFAYFTYSDDDCFNYKGNIQFDGCLGVNDDQGIARNGINSNIVTNARIVSNNASTVEKHMANMNASAHEVYPDWSSLRAAHRLKMFQVRQPDEYDNFIDTKQGKIVKAVADKVRVTKRSPGDVIDFNRLENREYAAREGDESGNVQDITPSDAATLADDLESNYREDQTSVEGSVTNTQVGATLTITVNQGTLSIFSRDFIGNIADRILNFIRTHGELQNYIFDLGNVGDGDFQKLGTIIYHSNGGRDLKKAKRARVLIV